jgi:threonylcarbamoyladenosine tRNA methylthiotransferase MtaB
LKYSLVTFGCRVNQADSLAFEEQLRAGGATASTPADADLVIVNTCSVTATADQGARQTIRRIARENPAAAIVVTGCYATRRPDELAALPNVARVVTNDQKTNLIPLIPVRARRVRLQPDGVPLQPDGVPLQPDVSPLLPGITTADRFAGGDGPCGASIEPGVAGRTAFTLRVQTGCSEPCTYCIIPSTRGAPRSVAPDRVIGEIHRIAAAGFKEIVLTGVHLGSYGRDLFPPTPLIDLLSAVDRSVRQDAPDLLVRISSLEPMDCSPAIVDLVAGSATFAPHFHLPLQHASDRILRAMKRPYTLAGYASLVDAIRARIPHASIGSDIIVGFPGETDDDFEQLAAYLERSPLTHVHVFPYSDRPGTEASAMTGTVHGSTIRERARRVREIGRRLTDRFHESQLDTVHRGLTLEDGTLVVTGNYLKVRIEPGWPRNEWVSVLINSNNPIVGSVVGGSTVFVEDRIR